MRSYKLYLAALFLLFLTALRLLYPAEAAQAQAWLHRTLDPNGASRALCLALGRALDGQDLRGGLIAVFELAGEVLS